MKRIAVRIARPRPVLTGRVRSRILALLTLAAPLAAQVVSPADRALYDGSTSTSYPLGRANCRLQELHADLGVNPLTLYGHSYRRDAVSTQGKLAAFQVELSVQLSIAARTPDQASSKFSDNEGLPIVVLPRGWVNFVETHRPLWAPAPTFEFIVPYATPFSYPGNATLCVDTTVYSNNGPNGPNANFTAYEDAHELFNDGTGIVPGFRYGTGCTAPGSRNAAYANFEFRTTPTGMEFDIQARYGMPTDAAGPGLSALLCGFWPTNVPWNARPQCTLLTSTEAIAALAGPNDAQGHWNGLLSGFAGLPVGMTFMAQIASGHFGNGVALSDASLLAVPPPGPTPVTVARIAHGSDHTSPTGTVSLQVPVVGFF